MKKFIQLKRHLHGLTYPLTLLLLPLFIEKNIMDFRYIGVVGVVCFTLLANVILAFLVEAYQGIVKKANRTAAEMRGSVWDMITSVVAGALAIASYYIFEFKYREAVVVFTVIVVLEIYRKLKLVKR